MGLDTFIERRARGVAATQSRRSFLGRIGKTAMVLAGVGVVEGLAPPQAFAHHICGHTGTTSSCSTTTQCPSGTYTGGSWYGCGCCSQDRARKITDCCKSGLSGGYCKSGYGVYCIIYECTSYVC